MSTRRSLHQSTLSMLSKCGMMAKYVFVDGLRAPPGIAMLIGTAAHISHAANLKHKASTGATLPREQVLQSAAEAFDDRVRQEGVALDDEEVAEGEGVALGTGKDVAVKMASVCADVFAPRINVSSPDDVERRFLLELPSFPFDLEGTMDVFDRPVRKLIDTKTAAQKPGLDDLAGDVQLNFYSFAATKTWPTEAPLRVEKHYAVKTKKPTAYILEGPAPTDFAPLFERIERAAEVFEKGAFMPVDPSGPSAWVCSAKYCGFWKSHCPFGKRARISVSMSQVL